MIKKDGGPAFPCDVKGGIECGYKPGMTLRDYFAGQSLAGMSLWNFTQSEVDRKIMAHRCYQMADAMIAERSKE